MPKIVTLPSCFSDTLSIAFYVYMICVSVWGRVEEKVFAALPLVSNDID